MKWIDIPPVWLLLCIVLTWLSRALLTWGAAPLRVLGTVVVGAGFALMLAAVLEMRRQKTTVVPHMQPDALVSTGVFGLSRNPIYLGDTLVLAGLALRWDAPLGLILVSVFISVIERRFILAEEGRLSDAFPDAFARYTARTRRWM